VFWGVKSAPHAAGRPVACRLPKRGPGGGVGEHQVKEKLRDKMKEVGRKFKNRSKSSECSREEDEKVRAYECASHATRMELKARANSGADGPNARSPSWGGR